MALRVLCSENPFPRTPFGGLWLIPDWRSGGFLKLPQTALLGSPHLCRSRYLVVVNPLACGDF